MVQGHQITLWLMGVESAYNERFLRAMQDAAKDAHAVAGELGISYQAVMKVLAGTTKMMAADNNSKAARFLDVDTDWLATGEGRRHRVDSALSPAALRAAALYDRIKREDDRKSAMLMLGALQRPDGVSIAADASSAAHIEAPPQSR